LAKNFYTCIIVPNASSRLHKLRIPEQALYVLAVIGVISFFVAVGLGFTYASMVFRTSDYDQLQAENQELKIEKKNLEVSAIKLSSKITELENLSEKLTKVLESDAFFKKLGNPNIKGLGGTTADYSTSDLLSNNLKQNMDVMKDRAEDLETHFRSLQEIAESRQALIRSTPTVWPVRGSIGSGFGRRRDPFTGAPDNHMGVDIVGVWGTPVHAPADGIVIYSQRKSDYGNLVVINHGKGLTTRFGHLSRFATRKGQVIHKGDVLGYVGTTGRSTAPHLHYEVRINDRPVNPRTYLPRTE
jgi:murein DD-endopeptidase MepM/ murein hydrolase activator NlpD